MRKILMSAMVALLASACGTMAQIGGSPAGTPTTATVFVGALVANQSPEVDREVIGRSNYLMPLYRGIQSGRMTGPSGEVRLFIQNGSTVLWEQQVRLENGIAKVALPAGTNLQLSAGLCVETSWPIAHQRVRPHWARPGQHVMCTEDGALFRYIFTEGRGRTVGDAYGVVLVRSRG